MADPARILVVAHQTAATEPLLKTVTARAQQGPASFHLVVPQQPHGLDRLMDPQDHGRTEAERALADALPRLSEAAGSEVAGEIGDPEPLMAIQDAINLGDYDEIIVSTLPLGVSRWLRLDLISKTRALGLPVTHVLAPTGVQSVA